ncbi:alanyl-tRNA editing protein [Myxococcota bacterium]|nr:alanyl-tRNA editing protein [Myxococcota bacterium]
MTKKLYLSTPQETLFEARVLETRQTDGHPALLLDQTLFYPTSGGQPHDTGFLEGHFGRCQVTDVRKIPEGILHLVEGDIPVPGDTVKGRIDWDRRLRHAQRHTAQHLLSQAFFRINPAFKTVSVSFMGPLCTVDLEGNPSSMDMKKAQALTNGICYKNLPITDFVVSDRELADYSLRRAPKVSGSIRLVAAGDWELAACGAPHLSSTAQAAPVKIQKSENIHGGLVRVSYQAGLEALADYDEKHDIVSSLAVEFSSRVEQLPLRVQGLRSELTGERETNLKLVQELTGYRFREGVGEALTVGSVRLMVMDFAEHEEDVLKKTMKRMEQHPGYLFLGILHLTGKLEVTLLRTPGVELSAGRLVRQLLAELEGRGGGRDDMARFALGVDSRESIVPLLLTLIDAYSSSSSGSSS